MVGGGFFSGYSTFSVSEAWRLFGEGNGVASAADLTDAINGYRRGTPEVDPVIGCVLLRDIFFVADSDSLDAPADFAKNIVRFKGYDLTAAGSPLEGELIELIRRSNLPSPYVDEVTLSVDGPTRGLARLVVPRVGQQAFKGLVLSSYDRKCAVTGNRIAPTLQAAHIRPVALEGQHRVDNGLLLRSDVHTLFDQGYLGVDDEYRLHVSRRLRIDFGNGMEFYRRAGELIGVPDRRADRPSREAATRHMDTDFRVR